jgi:hypothetical protein
MEGGQDLRRSWIFILVEEDEPLTAFIRFAHSPSLMVDHDSLICLRESFPVP